MNRRSFIAGVAAAPLAAKVSAEPAIEKEYVVWVRDGAPMARALTITGTNPGEGFVTVTDPRTGERSRLTVGAFVASKMRLGETVLFGEATCP